MHPLIRKVQNKLLKKLPEIRTGYTIRISQKIKEGGEEGKERIQPFEGLVIKMSHGEGPEKTFTVRKIVEGIGVEKTFPLHSPNITKIVVKKEAEVRRSKLYYMRKRSGKSARLSEHHVSDEERVAEAAKMEEYIEEAVEAEEKRKKEEEKKSAGKSAETAETEELINEAEEIIKDSEAKIKNAKKTSEEEKAEEGK